MFRKTLSLILTVLTVGAIAAGPALADETDSSPQRTLGDAVADAALDLPDVAVAVDLHCKGRVADDVGAVRCGWRANDDLAVRSWQLWNLQVRPEHGSRNLVAELGADASGYTDRAVVVPGAYLYAVLGLNGDGDVIARSRVEYVSLAERDNHKEILRLECFARHGDLRVDEVTDERAVVIGCEWSEATSDAAAGYVLWRSVDGGEREVVARTGLDASSYIDAAVSFGHRYTYVVQAVNADGRVVGMSRAEHVGLHKVRDHVIERDAPEHDEVARDAVERDAREHDAAEVDDAERDHIIDAVRDIPTHDRPHRIDEVRDGES